MKSLPRDGDTPGRAEILDLDKSEVQDRIAGVLRGKYGEDAEGSEELGRDADAGAAGARNWTRKTGGNMPGVYHFLRVMAVCPELQAEVRKLCGMEADIDPEFDRDMQRAMRAFQRWTDRRGGGR